MRKAGLTEDQLRYDAVTGTLTATTPLTDEQIAVLVQGNGDAAPPPADGAISEAQAEVAPSSVPWLNWVSPGLLAVVGCVLGGGTLLLDLCRLLAWAAPAAGFLQALTLSDWIANNTLIGLGIVATCTLISSWILFSVKNAERDRVLAIYALGVFVVFFWAAFEQAGNAMNLWADKTTNRHLTSPAPAPPLYPEAPAAAGAGGEAAPARATGFTRFLTMWQLKPNKSANANQGWGEWFIALWNPVSTEWFQSINALAIFVLAPLFAVLWVWLDRVRINPSTPVKMAIGVLLMSSSFGLMIFAGRWEDGPTTVPLPGGLPAKVKINDKNQLLSRDEDRPFQGGRLTYDAAEHDLKLRGVLPDTERDLIVREPRRTITSRRSRSCKRSRRTPRPTPTGISPSPSIWTTCHQTSTWTTPASAMRSRSTWRRGL